MDEKQQDQQLKDFWSIIAHDFTGPLSILNMRVDMLSELLPIMLDAYQKAQIAGLEVQPIRPDKLRLLSEFCDVSNHEIGYMNQYIRMLNKKFFLKPELVGKSPYSIKVLVQEVLSDFVAKYDLQDQTRLKLDIEDAELTIDKELISFVLMELFSNADYYLQVAGEESELIITGKQVADQYRLSFINTGLTIPEEQLPHIFDAYYSSRQKVGLGLHFCRQVMTMMGGEVNCQNIEGGVEFTLVFSQ